MCFANKPAYRLQWRGHIKSVTQVSEVGYAFHYKLANCRVCFAKHLGRRPMEASDAGVCMPGLTMHWKNGLITNSFNRVYNVWSH